MTNDEAIAIIRNEYKCVDRDCDIEKSCGKCDLMMPSKEPILEAYKLAIKALEQQPFDEYGNYKYPSDVELTEPNTATSMPCEDAISREDAEECKELMTDINGDTVYVVRMSDIRQLPSVTQKYGKWILADEQNKEDVENDNYRYICSECQCSDIHAKGTIVPYCWQCGAKMQESEEEGGKERDYEVECRNHSEMILNAQKGGK